jgi:hypothetical protein
MLGCGKLGMLGAVRCGRLLATFELLLRERARGRELPLEPLLLDPLDPLLLALLEPLLRAPLEPRRPEPVAPDPPPPAGLEPARPRDVWLPVEDDPPEAVFDPPEAVFDPPEAVFDPLDALLLAVERVVERERPDDRLLPLFARDVVAAILITSV